MMPDFQLHYNQGYTARPARIIVKPSDSELAIHEEIARAKRMQGWEDPAEIPMLTRTVSNYFTPISHHEMFAPIEQMKADIREAGGWNVYWAKQNRAYQNLLQSALGFEPTDHSDAPPYIPTTPTTKPQPCVDFGFEPTEASE